MRNIISSMVLAISFVFMVIMPDPIDFLFVIVAIITVLFGFKKKQRGMLRCPVTGNPVIDPKSPVCAACSKRFY